MKSVFAYSVVSLAFTLCFVFGYGQQTFLDQLPKEKRYTPEEVVDSLHGITVYERLNHRLSWDSTRNCKGYACQGTVKDYYTSGKLLHNGYYVEGQLNSYTNYYPNGNIERSFVIISDFESQMLLYFPNGQLKSKQKFHSYTPIFWKDYYPNGELSYHMEYDEELGSHVIKRMYNSQGVLTSEMYLSNKKKRLFRQNSYYETGVPNMKGELTFDEDLHMHVKNGKWIYFYPNGKVSKVEIFENNAVVSSKEKENL